MSLVFHHRLVRSRGASPSRRRGRVAVLLGTAALVAGVLSLPQAQAAGSNIGAGAASGSVTFDPLYPVPPGPECGQTSFTLQGESTAIVANTIIKGYFGGIDLTGSGGSDCETATSGAGSLTISVRSTGNDFLRCDGLTGSYSRVLTDVHTQLGGTCTVNNLSGIPVTLVFHGQFIPDGLTEGAGSEEPVTSAQFAGAYTLFPA